MQKRRTSYLLYNLLKLFLCNCHTIIGAGFAGIGAGLRLKMQGDNSFIICENGVMFNVEWIEVDAIIYGTGFYTTKFPDIFKIIGLNNRDLFKEFNEDAPEAYYGMTVHGFPMPLNSLLSHKSYMFLSF